MVCNLEQTEDDERWMVALHWLKGGGVWCIGFTAFVKLRLFRSVIYNNYFSLYLIKRSIALKFWIVKCNEYEWSWDHSWQKVVILNIDNVHFK